MSLVNQKLTPRERAEILRRVGFNIKKDRGQINNIKNICYDDTQPDLCIDLNTGKVKDWGDPSYNGDIFTLICKAENKDFKGAVKLVEDIIGRSLSDSMDGKNQAGALYSGSSEDAKKQAQKEEEKKKSEPFWNSKYWSKMEKCQDVLEKRGIPSGHEYIMDYDGISKETILKCNGGIYGFDDYEFGLSQYDYNNKAYYIFPYATGAMLYRRNKDGKEVKHIKGSRVKDSFFNVGKNEDKHSVIFIMKSPRECMNFMQYCTDWKVIGFCQGENIRELGKLKKKQLLKVIDKGECAIKVVMDCNNPDAYENSLIVCKLIHEFVKDFATVHLVNIHRHSEGKFKDFTDIVQYASKQGEWKLDEEGPPKLDDKSSSILIKSVMESEVI